MPILAIWLQDTYRFSSHNAVLLLIFTALVALAMVVQAVVVVWLVLHVHKTMTEMLGRSRELKAKLDPLIDNAQELTRRGQELMAETQPKLRTITDNLVKASATVAETSTVVRGSANKFDATITDLNQRAQSQVARVDGMISSALTSTTEAVEGIQNSIRMPAKKIVDTAQQVRYAVEGFLAKLRGRGAAFSGEEANGNGAASGPNVYPRPTAGPYVTREETASAPPYAGTGTTGQTYVRGGVYTRYAESQGSSSGEATGGPAEPYRR